MSPWWAVRVPCLGSGTTVGVGVDSGRAFSRARAEGRAALVGYLPAGFPTVDGAITACRLMVGAGVDLVEVGWPYRGAVRDGPVIRGAYRAALDAGVRPVDVLRTVEAVAGTGTPVVVMTYWQPVTAYGIGEFTRDLTAAGGVGVITADLPWHDAGPWLDATDAHGLERVWPVTPDLGREDLAVAVARTRGWAYAVSRAGVTSGAWPPGAAAPGLVARIRALTSMPVGVGFGVRNRRQATAVARYADGVIVGSALVQCLTAADPEHGLSRLATLTESLAAGVRDQLARGTCPHR